MSFIKTSNIIKITEIIDYIKEVQCPYCKTFLKGISNDATAMKCWHCKKEFRIEQDKDKWIPFDKTGRIVRTTSSCK